MTTGPVPSEGVRVFLRDIEVRVACGLHPWEQHPERPNRLRVSAEMWGRVSQGYLDYDRVRDHVLSWRDRPHTPLLETLAQDLAEFILDDDRVLACRVSVEKPDIFPETAAAGVELTRVRPIPPEGDHD